MRPRRDPALPALPTQRGLVENNNMFNGSIGLYTINWYVVDC